MKLEIVVTLSSDSKTWTIIKLIDTEQSHRLLSESKHWFSRYFTTICFNKIIAITCSKRSHSWMMLAVMQNDVGTGRK